MDMLVCICFLFITLWLLFEDYVYLLFNQFHVLTDFLITLQKHNETNNYAYKNCLLKHNQPKSYAHPKHIKTETAHSTNHLKNPLTKTKHASTYQETHDNFSNKTWRNTLQAACGRSAASTTRAGASAQCSAKYASWTIRGVSVSLTWMRSLRGTGEKCTSMYRLKTLSDGFKGVLPYSYCCAYQL